jgi:Predicted protease with the C-terminal PDZ domain
MSLISLYRVELRRMFLSRRIWVGALCGILTPLLGVIGNETLPSVSSRYIANPVLTATAVSAMLWAVLIILEASRLHRSGVYLLTDAASSPRALSAARMAAAMTVTAAVSILCAIVYLPYTAVKMEYLFDPVFYAANYLIFMLLTGWISVLFADTFYQITRRVELSVILYALLAYFNFSGYAQNDYFMRWLYPYVIVYSDGFQSWWFLRIGFYTRLMWLCIALASWMFSLLCVRKYEKNAAVSLIRGMRRVYLPVLTVCFAVLGAGLWKYQPFIDHETDSEVNNRMIDTPTTNASAIRYFLTAEPVTGRLSGRAEYDLKEPYTGEDKLYLNPGYRVSRMSYGGKEIAFRTVDDDNAGVRSTYFTIPEKKEGTLVIEFGGLPQLRKTHAPYIIAAFIDWESIQLGMRSAAPMLNYACRDGAEVEITIPGSLTPYLNDLPMTEYVECENGMKTWKCRTQEDSIYNFVAGAYETDTFTASDTNIHFVYGKAYEQAVRQYDINQAVKDVFAYCSRHYGALGLTQDQTMRLQQVTAMLMGGHAREGYLEWFETVLSPITLADADKGASATEVFIHEMIHQWWGGYGLVCSEEGSNLWSEEGITVYATYRLVKEKYGELYAKQYYVDNWRKTVEMQERNFYNRHPEYLEHLPEKYQTQLSMENESTNWYDRMPLMILKAEKLVGGEENMDKIMRKMYADRGDYAQIGFTYADFLDYCGLSESDLELTPKDYMTGEEDAGV